MINCVYTFLPLGGGGVMWTKLQEVLSSVEDSISCKRSWAAPITASDQDKHQEHLRAAQESWVKATQVLKTFFFFQRNKEKENILMTVWCVWITVITAENSTEDLSLMT